MQIVGVREEDAEDRERWWRMIRCGNSKKNLCKAEIGRKKRIEFLGLNTDPAMQNYGTG